MAYPNSQTLELNLPKARWIDEGSPSQPKTPSEYFGQLFPRQVKQFGCPFLELREFSVDGFNLVTPIKINEDFFASTLSDPRIGLSVVYFEPEMQFYYLEPMEGVYRPTSPEKLHALYRGLLIRSAQELNGETNKLSLFSEFRSDKLTRAIVQRAKSILAADSSFFSADSPNTRIKGIELHERLARKFVEEMLMSEPGQILKLHEAYEVFCGLLKERDLEPVNRGQFKGIFVPLIKDQFNVCLRNDLKIDERQGVRGWKDVGLLGQTWPGEMGAEADYPSEATQ